MLPTVGQWQYAAQGDDGTDYPWGTRWDASRCNNNVDNHGIGKTRPVQYYEGKGNSIFGVVDMVGNVWEWCQTASDQKTETVEGTHDRIICGGSWNSSNLNSFYSSSRRIQHPVSRHTDLGFRLVRT
jgi:formylglycine-generating enzyme required for sulfatase activity